MCPAFCLVGSKSNARRSNGMGRSCDSQFANSPPPRIRLTGWKLPEPAGTFRRLSATAMGSWENARGLGNFYASPSRAERYLDRMDLWLNAVWSVCRRHFEWIAPRRAGKPLYYALKMIEGMSILRQSPRFPRYPLIFVFCLFFFYREIITARTETIDTMEKFIARDNIQLIDTDIKIREPEYWIWYMFIKYKCFWKISLSKKYIFECYYKSALLLL